ncbi:hypothetical protein LTR56_019743 [Elasticomyces elasticus]|nr:hypothetical protein LTR56_019743 [Elasticomyces elasticus]KAK3655811.1 hypothetical protein LTR22_010105 [Elasticomyces elasticus]KAK4925850.1 hypothetical protein LTR49_007227 [Elasticomyces elasticus]KAK5764804.1 hypothetical protein LTS12_005074 [Elasticomyces elasticus]
MLAPYHAPPSTNPFAFRPPVSSPLSPRDANIQTPFMSSSPDHKPAQPASLATRRTVRKPPTPKQDDLKETRRRLFLRNVREKREDQRWAQRGEDIMRLDFVQRQRAWEAEQAREAPRLLPPNEPIEEEEDEDEELYDLPSSGSSGMQFSQQQMGSQRLPEDDARDEADAVLRREQEEIEALVRDMESTERAKKAEANDVDVYSSQNPWSDDLLEEDYDALFSEVNMDDGGGMEIMRYEQQMQDGRLDEDMDMS